MMRQLREGEGSGDALVVSVSSEYAKWLTLALTGQPYNGGGDGGTPHSTMQTCMSGGVCGCGGGVGRSGDRALVQKKKLLAGLCPPSECPQLYVDRN
jgi:hypothetical protein